MSKPLIVSIPHTLGKAEATRRLQGGLGSLKTQFDGRIASIDETWRDDRLVFRVGAMGQAIDGHLEVMDDQVLVEVRLPWILSVIAETTRTMIRKQGALLLEKK